MRIAYIRFLAGFTRRSCLRTRPNLPRFLLRAIGAATCPDVFNALDNIDDGTNMHSDPDNIQ